MLVAVENEFSWKFVPDSSKSTNNKLSFPSRFVQISSSGTLYVCIADTGNDRPMEYLYLPNASAGTVVARANGK